MNSQQNLENDLKEIRPRVHLEIVGLSSKFILFKGEINAKYVVLHPNVHFGQWHLLEKQD